MRRLEGRSIIVTGGASGIGRSLCLAFAAEGARVVVGDLRRDQLYVGGVPTDVEITEAGGVARFVQADASRGDDIDRLVAAALELGEGRLDVIVNNAVAGGGGGDLLETSEEDWDLVLGVGLRGLFLCCQRAVRQMLGQEPYGEVRGRIINISSQHGMVGAPRNVAYSAMKGGVVNITRQIAVDFAEHGIVCNAIAPGKIVVPREGGQVPEIIEYAHARTPWPTLGAPEDVASLAVFLASDDCRFMTGTNVLVDGGFMAY
jgi:glucose 1-dehydrogenase